MAQLLLRLIALTSLLFASCAQVPELGAAAATSAAADAPAVGGAVPTTADTPSTTGTPSTSAEPLVVPETLADLPFESLTIRDGDVIYVLQVAVAATPKTRAQGLMNVVDLADLDGMLFSYDDPSAYSFWMKDTILPLDIAFFDGDDLYVDSFPMQPCTTDDCPSYTPVGPFVTAVEVPQGLFSSLSPAARLERMPGS